MVTLPSFWNIAGLPLLLNLVDGMYDSCMMLAAEGPADLRERRRGQFFHQIHGNLARQNDGLCIAFFLELRLLDSVLFSDRLLDGIDGHAPVLSVRQML